MSWLNKWDRHNQRVVERDADLHRIVTAPDGTRYEVVASNQGGNVPATGSVLADVALMVRHALRYARGRRWSIAVTSMATSSGPSTSRVVRTRVEAKAMVDEFATRITDGRLDPAPE